MPKTIWVVSLMMLILTVAVLLVGCPKAPPAETGSATMPGPSAGPAGPAAEALAEPGEKPSKLADILASRQALTSYEAEITNLDGEVVKQLVKLQDNAPVKMMMETPEGSILMDMEEKVLYIYSPKENSAMKMSMEGEAGVKDMPTVGLEGFAPEGAVTGSEDLDGVACWVIETHPRDEDKTVKIWVDKKYGLLRQGIDDKETVTFTYSRLNKVRDSELELPADVEIIDMAEMMKGTSEGAD